MQNSTEHIDSHEPEDTSSSLQAYFKPEISFDDIEQVYQLKRAQPLLQAFTALFHGGFDSVLVRLLVLRELASDAQSSSFSRADINAKLAYLQADSLDTVLARLRSHQLLIWEAATSVYRVAPMARNVLSALDSLLSTQQSAEQGEDPADMGFLLTQVAGAQALGGVTVEQLQHLLGRLVDLTEEFRDAIASGSEYRLRASQSKWNNACDWVEKGTKIIYAITTDGNADAATQRAAQAIGRAQSALLNMQGMFSRALNQIERQRVHLGQSGLSTTDIKSWLMAQDDLAALADGAIDMPVTPLFATPAEMIDVAEAELFAERNQQSSELPSGTDTQFQVQDDAVLYTQLDAWLSSLNQLSVPSNSELPTGVDVQQILLPNSFAIASYRASLLPLIGDQDAGTSQGAAARLSSLPMQFVLTDKLIPIKDSEVAGLSDAQLIFQTQDN
ncbi:hypothetical protein [Solimicrobium silvestre]|uniref:Uncharacterized protein n=1 Tax=Solimicrobium silvestre TaxID=2099400 RepID=A0A2S9GXH1_9BURK|nr:hypothetical protein [Solimicrobium silvestre]PRC92422.1 hypothetical protein S2091_2797 [Solimicrobium silvestre]